MKALSLPSCRALRHYLLSVVNRIAGRSHRSKWVDEATAQQLTGLARTTLWRARQNPGSLISWKGTGHGVRYLYASLLAHNARRTPQPGTNGIAR